MKRLTSKEFWNYATERAIKTFSQTALATLSVGSVVSLGNIDFLSVLSIAGGAALMSVLTSLASSK